MSATDRTGQKYTKPIFFYVDEEMYESVRRIVFSKRVSKSEWIRGAIEALIDKDKEHLSREDFK